MIDPLHDDVEPHVVEVVVNGAQRVPITVAKRFTVIIDQTFSKIDIPEYREINPDMTKAYMLNLKQKEWEWIRDGGVFTEILAKAFNNERIPPHILVDKVEDFKTKVDHGMLHLMGLIIMIFEHVYPIDGSEQTMHLFLRLPETGLHPQIERRLVGVIEFISKFRFGKEKKDAD